MRWPPRQVTRKRFWGLRCSHCGNRDRFLEVMAYEYHWVDAKMNYIHLADSESERYECDVCGQTLEPGWHWTYEREKA